MILCKFSAFLQCICSLHVNPSFRIDSMLSASFQYYQYEGRPLDFAFCADIPPVCICSCLRSCRYTTKRPEVNTSLCGMYANDIPRAMRTSAAIQTAVALISAAAVSMPPSPSWTPEKKGSPRVDESIANEGTPLIEDSPSSPQSGFPSATYLSIEPDHSASSFSSRMEKDAISLSEQPMTTSEMMQYPAFYALLATVTSSVGPGFGVVLHGSRMQTVLFGVKPAEADKRFFFVTLVGVVGRLLVGMAVDVYGLARAKSAISKDYRNRSTAVENAGAIFELDGGPTKYAFEGAKVINAALLVLQTVALALVFIFIPRGFATLFVIAISAIYLTFSGAAVLMACLCRAVFMPINSTLAFSLIGLAIGMGDVVFSSLVASCSENNPLAQNMLSPSSHLDPSLIHSHAGDYNPYFITSLVFSILGLASALWLTPAKRPL